MTTTGEVIRSLLVADAATAAIAGARVYPNELPQNATLPAIVYTVVSAVPENSFTGLVATTTKDHRVQIDCYARPTQAAGAYDLAHSLAEAVSNVLGDLSRSDLTGSLENERDLYDNVTQYHRVSLDFAIWR